MYGNDLFANRKCVHVKIRAKHYTGFRSELLNRRLSMQEVFDEFALLIQSGDPIAHKILDRIVVNKTREKMEKIMGKTVEPTENQAKRIGKNRPTTSDPRSEEDFFDLIEDVNPINRGDQ